MSEPRTVRGELARLTRGGWTPPADAPLSLLDEARQFAADQVHMTPDEIADALVVRYGGHSGAEPPPAPMSDPVNHPAHYTSHPSGVECIQVTEHMGFNVGNAVKYLWRADLKGNALEDLRKARWYVEREIARREASS